MAIVTLTGHLGSMGAIDERVAETLGYALLDRELLIEAAKLTTPAANTRAPEAVS